MSDQMPAEMPRAFDETFSVQVRLLDTSHGSLQVETQAQTRARYDDLIANAEINFASDPKQLAIAKKQAEVMCAQETNLFAQVEKVHGTGINTFTFTFRVPKTRDVEAAEAEAAVAAPDVAKLPEDAQKAVAQLSDTLDKTPMRLRPAYRIALANSTLKSHDYPGFAAPGSEPPPDFRDLRNELTELVTGQVARRIYFSLDVRSFLGSLA